MVAVELCAGAGGLSRGFEAAGIKIAIAIEKDHHAAATYRANFPDVDLMEGDIESTDGEGILERLEIGKGDLGVLVAGLPCQGFSESNRRTRTTGNPRNHLYRHVVRLLPEIEPRWFVIENVAGISTLNSGRFHRDMIVEFEEIGYRVESCTLNARDFGVPQTRKRVFIVGTRTERRFVIPEPLPVRTPTVREAIGDLPKLENGASVDGLGYAMEWSKIGEYARELRPRELRVVTGNEVSRNSKVVLERYRYIGMGENWQAIPADLMRNYANRELCHTGIYYRLCWDDPAKVIGNFRKNMLVHPSENRGLSIREAARLQSFNDSHEFKGPLNDRQQQVGDAVPPRLAQAVGEALRKSDGD